MPDPLTPCAPPRRNAFISLRWAVTIAVLSAHIISGHELGTTRVSVHLEQGRTYQIEIVTDAGALTDKLAASSGRPAAPSIDPSRLKYLLQLHEETFRSRVQVAFDKLDVRPAITYSVTPGGEPGAFPIARIRLTGERPSASSHFSWNYGWTFSPYPLTIINSSSGTSSTQWLDGGQHSSAVTLSEPEHPLTRLEIASRYLILGFTHIVPGGLDHVLFVLGICLLGAFNRSVLLQVSAFTAAHSITLGLAMYGVVAAPPRIVEPLIAFSIAFIAIENVIAPQLKFWRLAVVFGFGLLHGMGFAGALQELGLPRSEFATALLTFNIGVEAGQLAVIGTAFLLVGWHCANRSWYHSRIVIPASTVIAAAAIYWTVERMLL